MPDYRTQRIGFALLILFLACVSSGAENDRFLPHLKTLDPKLIIAAAESLHTLIRECKPTLVWNDRDLLWAEADADGVMHFTLAEAQRVIVGKEKPAWVALRGTAPDDLREQGDVEYSYAVFVVTDKVPQHDGGAGNFAVALSSNAHEGTVYEIGWQATGTSRWTEERRIFVLHDLTGDWHFIVEENPADTSSRDGFSGIIASSTFGVRWSNHPENAIEIEVHVVETLWDAVEDERPITRNLEIHRDGLLRNSTPSIAWENNQYVIAEKNDTIDSIAATVGSWTEFRPSPRSVEFATFVTGLSKDKILQRNPRLRENLLSTGTHVIIPDLDELRKQLNP